MLRNLLKRKMESECKDEWDRRKMDDLFEI